MSDSNNDVPMRAEEDLGGEGVSGQAGQGTVEAAGSTATQKRREVEEEKKDEGGREKKDEGEGTVSLIVHKRAACNPSHCNSKVSGSANRDLGADAAPQPSIYDEKPAGFYGWSTERQTEWWAPRNAAEAAATKARVAAKHEHEQQVQELKQQYKLEKRQRHKQKHQQQKAAKAEEEKKRAAEAAERAQATMGAPTGPRIQSRPQHRQAFPARQPPVGRFGSSSTGPSSEWHHHTHAPYNPANPIPTVPSPYDPLPPPRHSPMDLPRPRPTAALTSAAPSAASPVVTAIAPSQQAPTQVGSSSRVQKSKPTRKEKKEKKEAKKKGEGVEKALEYLAEERKKLEEERKKMEEEGKKKMEEERKKEEKEKKKAEKEKKEAEKEKEHEERSKAAERQVAMLMAQNQRRDQRYEQELTRTRHLGLVESSYHDTISEWDQRIQRYRADHAAAVAAGDIARTARQELMLSRAREFRAQATNMVTDAREDLVSSEGVEARQQRFSKELTRALNHANSALIDMFFLPAVAPATVAAAVPPVPQIFVIHPAGQRAKGDDNQELQQRGANSRQMVVHAAPRMVGGILVDMFGRMVNPSGQLIDAMGELVDGDFYLIDPVSGQRRLNIRGWPVQGRRP